MRYRKFAERWTLLGGLYGFLISMPALFGVGMWFMWSLGAFAIGGLWNAFEIVHAAFNLLIISFVGSMCVVIAWLWTADWFFKITGAYRCPNCGRQGERMLICVCEREKWNKSPGGSGTGDGAIHDFEGDGRGAEGDEGDAIKERPAAGEALWDRRE